MDSDWPERLRDLSDKLMNVPLSVAGTEQGDVDHSKWYSFIFRRRSE